MICSFAASTEMPLLFCHSAFGMKRISIPAGINRLTAALKRSLSNPTTALIFVIPAWASASMV